MKTQKVSAIVITRNEEKNISRCLDSLRWVDEIVIIDQSSDDNTVNICRGYTDNIFTVTPKGYADPDRPIAVSKARNEWILYLDADETVTPELAEEIKSVLSTGAKFDSYYIPRKNIFLDKWIRGSGMYPDYIPRLFRKWHITFPGDIGMEIRPISSSCGHMKNVIIHYACEYIDEYLYKLNSSTSLSASHMHATGLRIIPKNRVAMLTVSPVLAALNSFFLKMGFMDRYYGIFIAFLAFLKVYLINAKVWEIEYNDSDRMDY